MTNEGLEQKIDGLVNLINSKFEDNEKNHKDVLTQVKYTNGRVRSLEKWKAFITGALAVLSLIISMLGIKLGVQINQADLSFSEGIKQVCLK